MSLSRLRWAVVLCLLAFLALLAYVRRVLAPVVDTGPGQLLFYGAVVVAGRTESGDFPKVAALQAAFAWPGERVEEGSARAEGERGGEAEPQGSRASRPHSETGGRDAGVPRELPRRARALGFGVWPLFADARFDVPVSGPFVRRTDVERIDAESIWNALS